MSHVDKGALHAYLDGALDEYPAAEAAQIREHLDQCAECAIQLEEERQLRSDAHAMLGLAAPEVDMPSLEELRAYVKRTRPQRPPAALRMYRMGWAASIVLALGAGWMLRGGQLQQAQLLDRGDFEVNAPVLSPAGARESTPVDGAVLEEALGEAVNRDVMVQSESEQRESSVPRQDAQGSAVTADAADLLDAVPPSVEAFQDRAELPADVVAKALEQDLVAPAEEAPEAQEVVATALAEVEALRAAEDHVAVAAAPQAEPSAGVAGGFAAPARADDTSATSAGAGASDLAAADPDEDTDLAGRERRRAESPVPMTLGLDRSGLTSQRFADDERKIEAEPLPSVPGYDVLLVTSVNEGTTFMGGRTVQRFDENRTFEIFNLEPEVDPSVLPELPIGLNQVRVQAETGWIVLRGPLPEDELNGLLAMLFPDSI